MNAWGQSCQDANQSLGTAVDAMGDLIELYRRDIDGKYRISKKTARQMADSLTELSKSLKHLSTTVSGVADAHSQALTCFLAGKKLDREQFYILLATECIEWTNRNLGISDFDDFELFELLRYEGKDKVGYIYLAADIDDLPNTDPDDWTLSFLARTYRKTIIAPETIDWKTLSPKQQAFFQEYLPQAVRRFIHDAPAVTQPEFKTSHLARPALSADATTRVDTQELIAALKALKVHLKSRRKLELLVRRGDRNGELVLELSGRSKWAGILARIQCAGQWKTETLVPVASFRGFVSHPPVDQASCLSFRDGRLHIGAWSCPARAVKVD